MNKQNILKWLKNIKTTIQNQNKKMLIVTASTVLLITAITVFSKQDIIKTEKIDFYTQTQSIQEFSDWIQINKPWKIVWSQEIVLSAQAMWWVKSINIIEWQAVWQNSKLIELNDDIANYSIMVQRAKNALNSARLQYSQNKAQLDQSVTNSQLTIEKLQNSLVSIQTIWEQNIRWAENNLNNADTQKNALILQMISEKNKLETFLADVLHKTDNILWATTQYKTNNDSYEIYLSAKNTSYKLTWKSQLLALYKQKENLTNLNTSDDISNLELKNNIDKMDSIYSDISTLLNTMENIFIKSVASTTFTQTTIDWLITANNALQTAKLTNFTYFTQFKQTVDSALIADWDNYIIAWNEAADIGYQSTIAATEQQISDIQIWIKTAELNYNTAIKNQSNTLWLSAANITNAELAYQEALKQYAKLIINAPITWTIWKILVDKWQEIRIWTPLLTIINNSDPIVEVWITAIEYQKINDQSIVTVEYMWDILSWEIISIWSQAWWNGLYNVIIKLNKQIDIIWDTAKITISSKIDKLTLPLNIVHPLEMNKWYIYIMKDNEPEMLNIELWQIRWDRIEIFSELSADTEIITNDISNYNPSIHKIIINK